MSTPTVDQILDLAHQLPREQHRQLVTRLEQELATEAPPERPPMTPGQARAAWARLRESMRDLPTSLAGGILGEPTQKHPEAVWDMVGRPTEGGKKSHRRK